MSACPRRNAHLGLGAVAGARVSCAATALSCPSWVMMEPGNTPLTESHKAESTVPCPMGHLESVLLSLGYSYVLAVRRDICDREICYN